MPAHKIAIAGLLALSLLGGCGHRGTDAPTNTPDGASAPAPASAPTADPAIVASLTARGVAEDTARLLASAQFESVPSPPGVFHYRFTYANGMTHDIQIALETDVFPGMDMGVGMVMGMVPDPGLEIVRGDSTVTVSYRMLIDRAAMPAELREQIDQLGAPQTHLIDALIAPALAQTPASQPASVTEIITNQALGSDWDLGTLSTMMIPLNMLLAAQDGADVVASHRRDSEELERLRKCAASPTNRLAREAADSGAMDEVESAAGDLQTIDTLLGLGNGIRVVMSAVRLGAVASFLMSTAHERLSAVKTQRLDEARKRVVGCLPPLQASLEYRYLQDVRYCDDICYRYRDEGKLTTRFELGPDPSGFNSYASDGTGSQVRYQHVSTKRLDQTPPNPRYDIAAKSSIEAAAGRTTAGTALPEGLSPADLVLRMTEGGTDLLEVAVKIEGMETLESSEMRLSNGQPVEQHHGPLKHDFRGELACQFEGVDFARGGSYVGTVKLADDVRRSFARDRKGTVVETCMLTLGTAPPSPAG